MTIRILADREPYASLADASSSPDDTRHSGPRTGSFVILSGPAALDEAEPDVFVMPAADFLDLPREPRGRPAYIAYGPVALMDRAFELGCVDYLREPWSLPELYARLGRLRSQKFSLGGAVFRLSGSTLRGREAEIELKPGELGLLKLLLRNSPLLVTREAAFVALSIEARDEFHALGRCAVALRRSLEAIEPGSGRRLHAVRGLGYRLDADACG